MGRQRARQQLQRLGRGADSEGVGLLRAQPLDGMVDSLQSGRQHEIHRRRERRRRIEHDHPRHDQAVAKAFLDAVARVADAGEGVELRRRERGRHGDHAHRIGRRLDRLRRRGGALLGPTGAIKIEILDPCRVLPQRD